MAVHQNALVDFIQLLLRHPSVLVQVWNENLFPLFLNIWIFIFLLVFDNFVQLLILQLDINLVPKPVCCFLMSLLSQLFQLVNHSIFLGKLEMEFPNFFLDVFHGPDFSFLLLFLLVVEIILWITLFCDQNVVFINIVKFALHVLLALLKNLVFVPKQSDFGLLLLDNQNLVFQLLFHLLHFVNMFSVFVLELFSIQNCILCSLLCNGILFLDISNLLVGLIQQFFFLFKQILKSFDFVIFFLNLFDQHAGFLSWCDDLGRWQIINSLFLNKWFWLLQFFLLRFIFGCCFLCCQLLSEFLQFTIRWWLAAKFNYLAYKSFDILL